MKNINKYILNINKINLKEIKKKDILKLKKKYLNKNGIINLYLKKIKFIKNKKELGKKINYLKSKILYLIKNYKSILKNKESSKIKYKINYDFFFKKKKKTLGSLHPISLIKQKIINIFKKLNFNLIFYKREIEDDYHNFDYLNFSKYHPSRQMQDTYYINKKDLLRTHTSSIQIRYMKTHKPPIRIITFGKVYRNETISKSSYNMFHQIEILYVDKDEFLSIIYLKNLINYLIINLFGSKYKYRYRISYFPFTKPSFELDIYYNFKWVEIIGCGMVHYKILKNVNYNYLKYKGLAIGIGVERIAMIYYNIKDIREFFKNDIRFLKQFKYEL
ncbi:MAG: phenylalanine--tRNA ligase subunit alpha [Candidatus Shikimatogenerans bostrichidophilus]|nr:MAG: phenylalanine--tRNA ligase subunit alpha [Candidatus Shikimatogenerans bostrichidophilus]